MKQIFYTFILSALLSCGSTRKDFLSKSDKDKTLYDAVKTLNKHPNDSNAINALPVLYSLAKERHLQKINDYSEEKGVARWDKMISEYEILQKMYTAINEEPNAYKWVSASSYQRIIDDTKELAANAYYNDATFLLDQAGRDNAKTAWTYYKKADKFVPGFKDSKAKMKEAYEAGIINVIINPVQDNSYYFNTGWGNTGINYSNEYFQQTLIRELGGPNATRYPARFFSDWTARSENITPDWVIDISLRYLDIPRPTGTSYQRNSSKQVEMGRDSSGRVVYGTVYATVYVTRQSFKARGQIDVDITEAGTRKNIMRKTYSDDYEWQEEHATYTGDSRALSSNDWDVINSTRFNDAPAKEDVLNELYRRIYPQVKNGIVYAVDW